jgi:DNA-binding CsgD family transcriptional regulator
VPLAPSFDRHQFANGRRPRNDGELSLGQEFLNKSISVFTSVGRSKRWIPEFSANNPQLQIVLACTADSFNKASRKNATYAQHPDFLRAVNKAGSYIALLGAVAYLAWRLRWHGYEISEELLLTQNQVTHILLRLCRFAKHCNFPTLAMPGKSQAKATPEQIAALWNQGRTITEIAEELGHGRFFVTEHLKLLRLYKDRRTTKHRRPRTKNRYGKTRTEMAEVVVPLWNHGMAMTEIAAFLSLSYHTVIRILKEQGVYVRRRNSYKNFKERL